MRLKNLEVDELEILAGNKSKSKESAILTFNIEANGDIKVLSRYGDDVWLFPDHMFPESTNDSNKRINFADLDDPEFIEPLKTTISRYYFLGRNGYKRPSGTSIIKNYRHLRVFLNYLSTIDVRNLKGINQLVGAEYVRHCKNSPGLKGQKISNASVAQRLIPVTLLYETLVNTEYAFPHPWPDSSASSLAEYSLDRETKTLAIPEEILKAIFTQAVAIMDSPTNAVHKYLSEACSMIILITTGIRAHELLSLRIGCRLFKYDDDDNIQYWIKGKSHKTHVGETEWLCPKICHRAIEVLENIQKKKLSTQPSKDETYLIQHKKKQENKPITPYALNKRLGLFIKSLSVDWHFTTHQCRRTFALYVVRNHLGDLRYLREHFKHWSIDMTALYAANENMDSELLGDLYEASCDEKRSIVTRWMNKKNKISGGLGNNIKFLRSKMDDVRIYKNQSEMISKVSESVYIRATGVGWCTSDYEGCNGGTVMDITRCADCKDSVIESSQKHLWYAIYKQQLELLKIKDIGEAGLSTVNRAIDRCEKVLSDLGADIQLLRYEVASEDEKG